MAVADVRLFRAPKPAPEPPKGARRPIVRTDLDDAPTGTQAVRPFNVSFRPDGGQIAFGGRTDEPGELYLLDLESGAAPRPLAGHTVPVVCLAYGPDGKRLVSAAADPVNNRPEVLVWDLSAGRPLFPLTGSLELVTTAAFSADGQTIATSGWDQTLRLWDARTGDCRAVYHGNARATPTRLVFVPGDRIVTLHRALAVQTWDLAILARRARSERLLLDLAKSAAAFAAACSARNDPNAAGRALEEAFRHADEAVRQAPKSRDARTIRAEVQGKLATLAAGRHDLAAARKHYAGAIRELGDLAYEFPGAPDHRLALTVAFRTAAVIEEQVFNFAAAAEFQRYAVDAYQAFIALGDARATSLHRESIRAEERRLEVVRLAVRAVDDLSFALDQDSDLVPDLLVHRFYRLARQGKHAELAETAARLAERFPEDMGEQYDAACGYVLAARSVEAGRKAADLTKADHMLHDAYADRAFELLGRAVQLGYRDLDHVREDEDLAQFAGTSASRGSLPARGRSWPRSRRRTPTPFDTSSAPARTSGTWAT